MSVTISGTVGVTFNDASVQNTAATGFGFKNRLINSAMVIDQRNAGASVTPTASTYTLDRWRLGASVASKVSVQQSTVAPEGFKNSALITSLSAYTITGVEEINFGQRIEGLNVADLGWGTANAKPVTFSFWVRSSLTGLFSGCIKNFDNSRSYVFSYTISSANTWEQKTVTIAGDTSGTWATSSDIGIVAQFSIASAALLNTAGVWYGTNTLGVTGTTQLVATNGATWYVTGVQLEKGSTTTSFDYRPYGTELALCQRYFEKSYLDGTAVGTFSAGDTNSVRFDPAVTSQNAMVGINFAARKRASPTMTAYDAAFNAGKTSYFVASWNNNGVTGAWNPYQSGATINLTGVTGAFAFSFAWIASSEL